MAKKQEKKTLPLLVGAIGFGVIAALLAMLYLNAREAAIRARLEGPEVRQLQVVVASTNLVKGQSIDAGNFALRTVPENYVHDDAVFPNEFESYLGQALTANLGAGKTLLKSFIDSDFPRDFSDIVPEGMRAMTVSVDELNSIGGHLRPGNRIDLYVNIAFSISGFTPELVQTALDTGLLDTVAPGFADVIPMELIEAGQNLNVDPEALAQLVTMATPSDVILPVVQNLKVLATGRDPYQETLDRLRQPQRRTEANFSTITVEVDPEQAALITLAQDQGEILALLRNRNDVSGSDFTTVSPEDLFRNASEMAAAERDRASRASVAAGVDANGNLVDADGNTLISSEALAAAGYTVNENGQIVDADGNVIDPSDIVVAADGTIMTKQQLADAGLTVNENGQIVDANGNVVDANDVVIGPDGKAYTMDQLAAAGLSVNENGEIVDASGKVVSADDLITTADGTVMTREQLAAAGISVASGVDENGNLTDADGNVIANRAALEAAGYTINENGEIIDADGNVVDPSTILVDANGNIVNPDDVLITADGTTMTKEQLAAAGLSINENGQIVDADGNVIDPDDLVTTADGTIMSKSALAAQGLSIDENGNVVDSSGRILSADEVAAVAEGMAFSTGGGLTGEYDLMLGGASEEGVIQIKRVQIQDD